jgi:hypothetical protein
LDPTLQQTLKVLWNVEVLSQMIMADPLVHLNPVVDELVCPWMKEFSNNIHIIKEQVPKHIVPRMISRRTGINSVDGGIWSSARPPVRTTQRMQVVLALRALS